MASKRNYKRKGYNKKKSAPKRATKAKSKTFEQKVLSVIHKQVETKELYTSMSDSALISFNSGINALSDLQRLLPNMAQGTAVNQRVGDRVKMMTHSIQGYFRIVPQTTAGAFKFGNVGVRMMVLSLKSCANYNTIDNDPFIATKLAGLLRKGGTTVGFGGLISDLQAPINRDLYTVHSDKVFHIKQDYVMTAVGTTTQDTLRMFKINLKVKNKDLKYSDDVDSALTPTNYAPFLAIGYSYMDGSTADTLATNLQLFFESRVTFEDA